MLLHVLESITFQEEYLTNTLKNNKYYQEADKKEERTFQEASPNSIGKHSKVFVNIPLKYKVL